MLGWMHGRISAAGGYSLCTMSPPVHAAAFGKLRQRVEEEVFGDFGFSAPGLPVVADQDGSPVTTAAGLRTMLLDTFDRPVHWERVARTLKGQGVRRIRMAGPENVFARLDRTTTGFELLSAAPDRTLRQRDRGICHEEAVPCAGYTRDRFFVVPPGQSSSSSRGASSANTSPGPGLAGWQPPPR